MNWRILAAITVVCWGTYNIGLKWVSSRLDWRISMFWFVMGYALLVGGFCLMNLFGQKVKFLELSAIWPLACGVLCGIGAITFFKAIPLAPGSLLMPIVGLFVLVSSLGCLIFFKEPITLRVVMGIILATAAIILLSK
jgi:drug/metabolite transporter (DMT)-like permease